MDIKKVTDLHNLAEIDLIIKGGKSLPIGTKRTHGGKEVQKTAKGWVPVKKDGSKKGESAGSTWNELNEKYPPKDYYLARSTPSGDPTKETFIEVLPKTGEKTSSGRSIYGKPVAKLSGPKIGGPFKPVAAPKKESDTYFKTLSGALDQVRSQAKGLGFEVDEDDMFNNFGTGGISYGTTKSANITLQKDGMAITSKGGKEMNRSLHVSLYRMDSGTYELTAYKTW